MFLLHGARLKTIRSMHSTDGQPISLQWEISASRNGEGCERRGENGDSWRLGSISWPPVTRHASHIANNR